MSELNPERFIESRSIGRRKYHKCLRCGRNFLCPEPETCKAGVNVSPRLFVKGKLVAHCPEKPNWEFIREFAEVAKNQEDHGVPLYEHKFFDVEAATSRAGHQEGCDTQTS